MSKHHRVIAVLSADGNPLIDATDRHEHGFVDAVQCMDAERGGILVLPDRAIRKGANSQNNQ
jgi:hypothetical protein